MVTRDTILCVVLYKYGAVFAYTNYKYRRQCICLSYPCVLKWWGDILLIFWHYYHSLFFCQYHYILHIIYLHICIITYYICISVILSRVDTFLQYIPEVGCSHRTSDLSNLWCCYFLSCVSYWSFSGMTSCKHLMTSLSLLSILSNHGDTCSFEMRCLFLI